MAEILFGGHVVPAVTGGRLYAEGMDLDSLSPVDFRGVFYEWITQCWLYDNPVPNDAAALAAFDVDALVPTFRRAFSSGAWRRMRAGRGGSAEEYVLFLQLVNRKPCVLVLNQDQPQPQLGRVRHKILMPEAHIGACLIGYLALVSRAGSKPAGAAPIMLYDGRVGHVITVRSINDAKDWIGYDDPTWPSGQSMLCEGQNAAGVQAQHFGNADVGEWIVHVTQLFRVVFGVPVSLSEAPVWRRWAREFDGYLRDRYRLTFGKEFPPEH